METSSQLAYRRAAHAYGTVGVTTGVDCADPHGLVLMLFDGALEAIARARAHMAAGDVAAKGAAVSHAVRIIEQGLNASLDRRYGGELAASLGELYDYLVRRLLLASVGGDVAGFDEASRLVADLRGAWVAAAPSRAAAAPAR